MHGGQLVAKTLKSAGVECVFTLSGGHIMPIYDGCLDYGIKVVDVRHEQAAARYSTSQGHTATSPGPGEGVFNGRRHRRPKSRA